MRGPWNQLLLKWNTGEPEVWRNTTYPYMLEKLKTPVQMHLEFPCHRYLVLKVGNISTMPVSNSSWELDGSNNYITPSSDIPDLSPYCLRAHHQASSRYHEP